MAEAEEPRCTVEALTTHPPFAVRVTLDAGRGTFHAELAPRAARRLGLALTAAASHVECRRTAEGAPR